MRKKQQAADEPQTKKPKSGGPLTIDEVLADKLTPIANLYWAPGKDDLRPFDPQVIEQIYYNELSGNPDVASRVVLLELSSYLENYLWKNFDPAKSTFAHVMSIIMLVNEKFRENLLQIWEPFHQCESVFIPFFHRVLTLQEDLKKEQASAAESAPDSPAAQRSGSFTIGEHTSYLVFFIHSFQSLEDPTVRQCCLRLSSLWIWRGLSSSALEAQLRHFPELRPKWQAELARTSKKKPIELVEKAFLRRMIDQFFVVLRGIDVNALLPPSQQPANNAAASSAKKTEGSDEDEDSDDDEAADADGDADMAAPAAAAQPEAEPEPEVVPSGPRGRGRGRGGRGRGRGGRGRGRGGRGGRGGRAQRAWAPREALATQPPERQALNYCERFLELVVDLLAQLPTRRFFHALILDRHFVVRCQTSAVFKQSENDDGKTNNPHKAPFRLFRKLLESLKFYEDFEIDQKTGQALTDKDIISRHYDKLTKLQRIAYKHFKDNATMMELAVSTVGSIDNRATLSEKLSDLKVADLRRLCVLLGLLDETPEADETPEFLREIVLYHYERRVSQRQQVQDLPLYPPETLLFDDNSVPTMNYTGETCLALPKLNLQFLTVHDYLLRNFHLFRLESTFEIRGDIVHTVQRLRPRIANNGTNTVFTGWARMALPIYSFAVTKVKKPLIGEIKPAEVIAEVTVDLTPFQGNVRMEWENTREHDVFFLLTVRAPKAQAERSNVPDVDFFEKEKTDSWVDLNKEHLGIVFVRGCEVRCVLDEHKKIIGQRDQNTGIPYVGKGNIRTYRVLLDTAQYQLDTQAVLEGEREDPYTTFNLLLRRQSKENNFKAVLKTIRDLMQSDAVVPPWLYDVFLGYGDPTSAMYYNMPATQLPAIKFADTFLGLDHLTESFPGKFEIKNDETSKEALLRKRHNENNNHTQFEVAFPADQKPDTKQLRALLNRYLAKAEKAAGSASASAAASTDEAKDSAPLSDKTFTVQPYYRVVPHANKVKRNTVRFTPTQVEAIKSGLNPGLTIIQGPPGTGKTDTAVQIMAELFHNFPNQRCLVVTHSNHALNDLFEKIMERDIDERYLLRLGRGEESLRTDKDFSRFGRVNHMLSRRLALLDDMAALATSLGMGDDVAYTCETAGHFFLNHILARWEKFLLDCKPARDLYTSSSSVSSSTSAPTSSASDSENKMAVEGAAPALTPIALFFNSHFPFLTYFTKQDKGPLFTGASWEDDMLTAETCFLALKEKFAELEECRPFELLRNGTDRGNYLLSKHAKVIAMTCTHAAITRERLVELGFQYDNLIMEEAAQILEIETLIPMLLQQHDAEFGSRLKRVILLGDHHQLPPIIQNRAFEKYSHMDQSLFTRFVRLGMPVIQLNAQGRCRPSIAELWSWRYDDLANLPQVVVSKRFRECNPGLAHEFQLINVGDYNGHGEASPQAYFYQNLGEAEYLVQTYMYMRLMGYDADRISVITPYNGQKDLLTDVFKSRCERNPLFGMPRQISTVDKFQGQQNDYILMSMVRTKSAGHIRDIRRLVVAMSRARLGLYIFCRVDLFKNCYELTRTFNKLLVKPVKLEIVPSERNAVNNEDAERRMAETAAPAESVLIIEDVVHMGRVVTEMTKVAQAEWDADVERQRKWEEEQRAKAEEQERREREYREAREAAARADAEDSERLNRDTQLSIQSEALGQKLAAGREDEEEVKENEDGTD